MVAACIAVVRGGIAARDSQPVLSGETVAGNQAASVCRASALRYYAGMRADYELASRALRCLIDECNSATATDLPARHSDLAEFFHSSDLMQNAYRAARHHTPGFPAMLVGQKLLPHLWDDHARGFTALILTLRQMGAEACRDDDLETALETYFHDCPQGCLGGFLRSIEKGSPAFPKEMSGLRGLLSAVDYVDQTLQSSKRSRAALGGIISSLLRGLSADVERGACAERFIGSVGTFTADSHLRCLRELRAHLTNLEDEDQPLQHRSPRFLLDELSETTALSMRTEVRRLAVAVNEQLISSRSAAQTMARLKLRLERFARVRLLSDLSREPRNKEKMVQAVIDEHLFGDGFFPISHVHVGGGITDTLAALVDDSKDAIEQSGQPPILLEIKQCVELRGGTRYAALRHAYSDASLQVQQYEAHCRANYAWRGLEPWVVIVYDGEERYIVRNPPGHVQLCYLGDTPPSKPTPIELP